MKPTLFIIFFIFTAAVLAQPPYSGTIFIDPDIITASDPSALESTTYKGQKVVTMYDRRVSDWVSVNAYLFDVVWNDGLTCVAQVNPEFEDVEAAAVEAEKYAFLIGQLPHCLREDINEIWIHKGVELFGGGNHSILIHTGQSSNYERDGIIEETLVHEACHTSLDATHAAAAGWLNAQQKDGTFISTYARDNSKTEDVAESFLPWLAVKYRKADLSDTDYNKITGTIPNRLAYFDAENFNLYPFEQSETAINHIVQDLTLYPNPVDDVIMFEGVIAENSSFRIYNLTGIDVTNQTICTGESYYLSGLPAGCYTVKVDSHAFKVYKQH
ncbi:T9SS type A sorting domain-containing protein [Saccharicrinis sp. FJH54]|uniref:T9SS type A sorting domain-containing protein n=1 Tax=Saccharicrinis sp. FJH54 TaxID=3344665 RepID=UPI0035D4A849